MKNLIQIGKNIFKTKKDALSYFKNILNSYNVGESLKENDFIDVFDLIVYDYSFYKDEDTEIEDDCENEIKNYNDEFGFMIDNIKEDFLEDDDNSIIDIKIGKFHYGSKCFEIFYNDDTSCFISYIGIINRPTISKEAKFNLACRNAIYNDLNLVKRDFFKNNFKNGFVNCQETKIPSKWEDLVVDHRQPNTFSVIVDRFIELFNIDLSLVKYYFNEINIFLFEDNDLSDNFKKYHKEKANLRVVRKECNLSRTGMARNKRSNSDLFIK